MLGYFIILLALTVLCNGDSRDIKESYSCRDSQTNEVCVGHQLECDEGKEIYVLNGRYVYSKTERNCSSLPNGNCTFDNQSYCSLDYITSVMDDAVSECNGLRSCSPPTPRRASSSYCVKYIAYRFSSYYDYYTSSYLSYICISGTSRGPNPNHEPTTNPYPRPISSSTSTPISSTTKPYPRPISTSTSTPISSTTTKASTESNGDSTVINESYSCRDSQTNEVCVGHQLECDEGKVINVVNGRYMYSKTDSNCSSLPNGNCTFDKRSYCSQDYITSVMDDAVSECNGLRSCNPQTPRGVSNLFCVKYIASFHYYYTISYLSYTCISAPKTIRIDENIGTTKTASNSQVVVMGNINRNTVCSLRVDHSVDFVFTQSNKEKAHLNYLLSNLRPLHRYIFRVKYTPNYFKMNFRGPLTDLKINLTSTELSTKHLNVTTYCSMETATSRGPNPNHEPTTKPYPRPISSSTSTPISSTTKRYPRPFSSSTSIPIWSTTKSKPRSIPSSTSTRIWSTTTNGWDKWTDFVDSDEDETEEHFKTTEHPKNEPKASTTEHPKSESKTSTTENPKSETKASTISNEYKIALGVGLFAFIAFILSVVVIVLKR